jgi:paraquat-inducible protein B
VSADTEIDLDFDGSVPAKLHPDIVELPEIPLNGAASGQVVQRLSELPLKDLANNAMLMMQSVRALADTLSKSLPQVMDSTLQTSVKAAQTLDTARTAITELQTRMNVTLVGVDRLTDTANGQLSKRGAELHTLLVSSNQAISDARDVLSNVKSMTDDRAPDRANLDAALNDLSAASAALRGFATDIEQNPQLLLSGRRR